MRLLLILCPSLLVAQATLFAQATITLSESTTVQSAPLRLGLNNGSGTNYDPGQIYKNWLTLNNPAFQGTIAQMIINISAGTTSGFTGNDVYDGAPVNIWAGATYSGLPSPSGSAFAGTTGTIASNTAASYPSTKATFTFSSTGSAAASGDWVRLFREIDSTTGGTCNQSGSSQLTCMQYWTGTAYNSAVLTAQTADLPASTYDTQTLKVDTTATNAVATMVGYIDGNYSGKNGNLLALWNGASYTFSMKCKTTSGTGTVTFALQRSGGFNSNSGNVSCTNSWSTVSWTFNGTETSSTPVGTLQYTITFNQGAVFEATDSFLGQTTYSNPTIYNDNYVNALKAYAPDTLRLWDANVGDSFDDSIRPVWGRHWSFYTQAATYFSSGETFGTGFYDHLYLCQYLGVHTCTLVIPASWTTAEYQHLIQFIAGTSGTYPTKRNALDALYGRTNGSFAAAIPTIILELTDEPWNNAAAFAGENMPDQSDGYGMTAYGLMVSQTFATIKADSTYASNVKLAVNCQTGGGGSYACLHNVFNNANNIDYTLYSDYVGAGNSLNNIATVNQEFDPQSGFAYSQANDATNGYLLSAVNAFNSMYPSYPMKYAVYESGYGTSGGSVTNAQIAAHNAAMINAPQIVQSLMENQKQLGITQQNIFQSVEDFAVTPLNPIWGIFKDPDGGQLAGQNSYYFRQMALGIQIANACIGVGSTEYGATVAGETTYSTSAINNCPAWSNLPYMTAYAFKGGTAGGQSSASANNRCVLLVSNDPTSAESFTLSGNTPGGNVSKSVLTGSSISANNETSTPGVTIVSSSGAVPGSVPAYSVMSLSWQVSAGTGGSSVRGGVSIGGGVVIK